MNKKSWYQQSETIDIIIGAQGKRVLTCCLEQRFLNSAVRTSLEM